MSDELHTVRLDRNAAVLCITLNRPAVLNAMSDAMMLELRAALRMAHDDASIRAVLLRGEGRGFSAGADLAESNFATQPPPFGEASRGTVDEQRQSPSHAVGTKLRQLYHPVILAMRSLPKPIVTAVQGVAAGAGMSLALAGDIILCSASATFVQAFAKIGLIPDAGSTWLLPRLVGEAKARALMLLAERISAEEAERIGLVYKVLPDKDLEDFSMRTAQDLATMPTLAYALTKEALAQTFQRELSEQLELEAQLQAKAAASEDCREGIRAFLEKRPPLFTGR